MNWKPNKWIATGLNLATMPLGLVYAGAPRLGALLFGGALLLACAIFFLLPGPLANGAMVVLQLTLVVLGVTLGYRVASRAPPRAVRPGYTRWYGLLAIALLYLLVVVGLRACFYETFRAPSTSMAPTIRAGANLLVQKWGYGHVSAYGMSLASRPISAPLKRGDIIAFDFPLDPTQQYVKRVVGLPGDKVQYRERQVFVNGGATRVRPLDAYFEPDRLEAMPRFENSLDGVRFDTLLNETDPGAGERLVRDHGCVYEHLVQACEVPPGHYFVMGDNRDNSYDSRFWGFVRADQVLGKVVRIMQ
ncbi:signal peptidase I [Massilia rubra]|uniref:Signal peptidase I n=1 Tax=Massilia rubra TaxID=2607910 RepID=A0ABX0LQ61_9BURK|nr:signal peptidase I [Massilia rubra]NHZ36590.1 signal peptidase I [Massilia rubra]